MFRLPMKTTGRCLAALALLAQLLMPAAMAHTDASGALCGNGAGFSALERKLLAIAPPELIQSLGYSPVLDDRHCDLCLGLTDITHHAGPAAIPRLGVLDLPLPASDCMVLESCSGAGFDARGPPRIRS